MRIISVHQLLKIKKVLKTNMKINHSLSHLEPEKPTWQPHSKKVVLCLVQVPAFRQETSQVSAENEKKYFRCKNDTKTRFGMLKMI
jgi:hypothetical protein